MALRDHLPPWLRRRLKDGSLALRQHDALEATFVELETDLGQADADTVIAEASGAGLDRQGRDLIEGRRAGQTDEQYRATLAAIKQGRMVDDDGIRFALDKWDVPYDLYEFGDAASFWDVGFYDQAIVTVPPRQIQISFSSPFGVIPSFNRASQAWYDGQPYAAGVPRFPSQSGIRGVMVEEGTANQLPAPQDWTAYTVKSAGTTVTANESTFVPSAQAADKVVMDATNNYITQRKTGLAAIGGQSWTFSALVYSSGAGSVFIAITDGVSWAASRIEKVTLVAGYNWVTVSHTFPGGNVRTVIDCELCNYDDSNNTAGAGSGKGATASGAIAFWVLDSQLEQKGYRTSFTPTTRNAETLTVPTAGLLTPSAGSVTLDYTQPVALNSTRVLWRCEIDANNYWSVLIHSSGRPYLEIKSGGVGYSTYSGSNAIPAAGTRVRLTLRYTGATCTHFTNGTKSASGDMAYTTPVGTFPALMWLGSGVSGAFPSNPVFYGVHTYTDAVTDAEGVAASLGSPPSDFTAYLDFTDGYLGPTPAQIADVKQRINNAVADVNRVKARGVQVVATVPPILV